MRRDAMVRAMLALGPLVAPGLPAQQPDDLDPRWLGLVYPSAERFGPKQGDPLVYEAYATDPVTGTERLVGFVFLTSDLPSEERGYNAPIEVVAGGSPF